LSAKRPPYEGVLRLAFNGNGLLINFIYFAILFIFYYYNKMNPNLLNTNLLNILIIIFLISGIIYFLENVIIVVSILLFLIYLSMNKFKLPDITKFKFSDINKFISNRMKF